MRSARSTNPVCQPANTCGRLAGRPPADSPRVYVRAQQLDHFDQLRWPKRWTHANPSRDACRVGFPDHLDPFGDRGGTGFPFPADVLGTEENGRGVLPTITGQNIEDRAGAFIRRWSTFALGGGAPPGCAALSASMRLLHRIGRGLPQRLTLISRESPSNAFASARQLRENIFRGRVPLVHTSQGICRTGGYWQCRQATAQPEYKLSPRSPANRLFREAHRLPT